MDLAILFLNGFVYGAGFALAWLLVNGIAAKQPWRRTP